jgi:hypothetical protein
MIPELAAKVERLHELLKDPQPSSIQWCESVTSHMKIVRDAINNTLGVDDPA